MALLAMGCAEGPGGAAPPSVSREVFEAEVYPVLLRDCGFAGCHGTPERFFRVYGPGRLRLDPTTGIFAAASEDELEASFDRARSMLSGAPEPAQALLVRKPLDAREGGAGHMGRDSLGRNVYASTDEPGWRTIAAWAGAPLPPRRAPLDAGFDGGTPDASSEDASMADGGPEDAAPGDADVDGAMGADAGDEDAATDDAGAP